MIFRVELSDKQFNRLEYLEDEIYGLNWEYARLSGCGAFGFNLPRSLCEEKYLSGDFNIKIKRRNPSTGNYDLRYQGLIERKEPVIRGNQEYVSVEGHGYGVQLERIRLTKTYTSDEISVVVKDILDTYITPYTDITYDAGDVEATSFTADKLEFKNASAYEALRTCAETAGGVEWGVDRDRKFFFKARGTSVNFRFPATGGQLTNYSYEDDFSAIVNFVYIQGGEVGGSPYTFDDNDAISITKYGRREKVIQNSAIVTQTVAQQFIDATLAEYKDVVRRSRANLEDYETLIENTTPLGLLLPKVRGVFYGEKEYGTFLYSGRISFQINRIAYAMVNNGADLNISLALGELRPDEAEYLSRLENKIEALRTTDL